MNLIKCLGVMEFFCIFLSPKIFEFPFLGKSYIVSLAMIHKDFRGRILLYMGNFTEYSVCGSLVLWCCVKVMISKNRIDLDKINLVLGSP